MSKLISWNKLLMSLAEPTKQNNSKKVKNDKNVKISAIKKRKIITTIANAILASGKL